MRPLAYQLASRLYGGRNSGHLRERTYSTFRAKEELSLEDEAERKVGWFLKLLFAGTAAAVGYQFFPYMGDNLMQQSISLLHVKDPLFKRMGASRLARFAIDDDRRMKIVHMGGGQELLKMLESAKDDRTRKEALKALAALSTSDEAIRVLHSAGLVSVVKSIPDSSLEVDIQKYRLVGPSDYGDFKTVLCDLWRGSVEGLAAGLDRKEPHRLDISA